MLLLRDSTAVLSAALDLVVSQTAYSMQFFFKNLGENVVLLIHLLASRESDYLSLLGLSVSRKVPSPKMSDQTMPLDHLEQSRTQRYSFVLERCLSAELSVPGLGRPEYQ